MKQLKLDAMCSIYTREGTELFVKQCEILIE